ncbi:MAG: lipopolysaccharide biosynthesis protein, partial [Richelia sp.]|nr:lipopolysaccharide biosynthesis protein [Richelia sp.]
MNSNNIHPQVESDEKSDLENQKYVEVKNNPWIQPRNRQIDEKTVEILENENPEAQKGLDLRWLVRTAQRKALLIIGITSLTTAAWYVNSRANPVYQGSFQLLVEPVTSAEKLSDPSTLTRTAGVPNERLFELDYPTIMQILTSPGMLSNIVKEIKLKESDLNISAAGIKQNLVVQRLGGERRFEQTKIINITYQGIDPKIVNLVLEVTAQRYLRYSLEER